jgi:hypothetical protein
MFASLPLSKPRSIFGHRAETLEDAAYYVRQRVIKSDDVEGRRLVRQLRDAIFDDEIVIAEMQLERWLRRQRGVRACPKVIC